MKNSMLFIDMLLLIGAAYLSSCSNDNGNNRIDYSINHYVDTINGHVVLTTVCSSNYSNNLSVSTLKLNNN